MKSHIAMGIGAGIASATLFVAAASLSMLSFILFLVAPLPLFIAGLGWGSVAAGIGALAGTVLIGVLFGFAHGFVFLVSLGLAPVILCRLAWLSRPAAQTASGHDDREWYPMGRLVLWAAAIAGSLVAISILRAGPSAEAYFETMRSGLEQAMNAQPELADALRRAGSQQLDGLISFFIRVTPMVVAALWTLIMTGNVWLGTKVLAKSGRTPRPWQPFFRIEFPRLASLGLGVALVATLLPGALGLIAEAFASALVCAFAILGFAVLHYVTRDYAGRVLVLATAYMAIVMFNWLAALIFAVLGVVETGYGLRARKDAGRRGGPTS